jgi:hypothetical protein
MKEHAECTWVLFNPQAVPFVPVLLQDYIPKTPMINIGYKQA